jgi:transcriptional regulator with XRE-family HTH domain
MRSNGLTTYEEMLAEDSKGLRREELIVEVTEALARALRTSGLTQSELAARLGKSKGFVSQILGGGRNLTLGTLADVAGALGCKVQVQLRPCVDVTSERPAADLAGGAIHKASKLSRKV